ncbi:MAG TPA: RNA methyltransferase [Saprospiraceae bacterium]|nr:RNA methyltransferase [Saprospiraceae bacterium]
MLPPDFQQQMQTLLGAEYAAFEAALQEPAPVSIRLHSHKTPPGGAPIAAGQPVPWHPKGYYLPERPVFTLDPLLHAGAYYVQEASSMFVYEAARQTADFSKPLKVLDLCAAPGGKSTLLADMLAPGSLLVANEVIQSRVGVLRENLERWGLPDIAVVSADAEAFGDLSGCFDVVLADAPCSGEGLFRKDTDARDEWSPAHVGLCAARQRRILAEAVETLAPGGVLLYSTCTYNRQENEDNVEWLRAEFGLQSIPLDLPAAWGIVANDGQYHFYPHRLRGEGFFLAALRKNEGSPARLALPSAFRSLKPLPKAQLPDMQNWMSRPADFRYFLTPAGDVLALPAALEADYLLLDKYLKNKWFGLRIGQFKGKDFAPDHALALSTAVSEQAPRIELSRELALRFLKKETFDLPPDTPKGWALAAFHGLALGWIKVLPNRMNNYLPAERRIRMELKG